MKRFLKKKVLPFIVILAMVLCMMPENLHESSALPYSTSAYDLYGKNSTYENSASNTDDFMSSVMNDLTGMNINLTAATRLFDEEVDEPMSSSASGNFEYGNLSGTVTDASGKGLAGVTVTIFNYNEGELLPFCTTNASGVWNSGSYDVVAGYEYLVSYYKAGFSFSSNDIKCTAETEGSVLSPVTASEKYAGKITCTVSDYEYTIADKKVTITKYKGSDEVILIPETIEGYPVEKIGDYTFSGNTYVKTVCVPFGITEIGERAFQNCKNLTKVELPDSVTKIRYRAFYNCAELAEVNYPKGWNYSGGSIFEACPKATKIEVPEGVTAIPGSAFSGSQIKTIKLPETLTSIGNSAFSGCTNLVTVSLPSNVLQIGEYAFFGCTGLERIDLPSGLTEIGRYAFSGCTNLTGMKLPDSVSRIGDRAFYNCTELAEVNYPKSWSYSGGSVFENCPKLTSMEVPEGVTAIPGSAFSGSQIKTIKLPETLTSIGNSAFSGCTNLVTVSLPSNVLQIGEYAFFGCTGLERIDLPSGLTEIGRYAFSGCTNLTGMKLPDSVSRIGDRAFYNCTELAEINYPKSWSYSGGSVFENCPKLTTMEVPEGVTAIPGSAFSSSQIKTIKLPETLTSIGNSAFSGCTQLRLVILPDSVYSVGQYAFSGCSYLRYVLVTNPLTTFNYRTFYNCARLNLSCPLNSMATIYAIDNDIALTMSTDTGIIGNTVSYSESGYVLDAGYVTINGNAIFTVNYKIHENRWGSISNRNIKIRLANNTEIIENSLKVDGELCTNYSLNGSELVIPVTKPEGTIRYTAKVTGSGKIQSYALLNFRENNENKQDIVGVINENFEAFTLDAPALTSSTSIHISGAAPASTKVSVYVDRVLVNEVQSNRDGSFNCFITLGEEGTDKVYHVSAECINESGEKLTASRSVSYKAEAPELTGLIMYPNASGSYYVDLFGAAEKGVKPSITYPGHQNEYKFEISFKNAENLDSVFVTSTRNNVKKSIQAFYNPDTGLYEAEGYFDVGNSSYVPGTINVEYNQKHSQIAFDPNIDMETWNNLVAPELSDAIIDYTVSGNEISGSIDFSGVEEKLAKTVLKFVISEGIEGGKEFLDYIELAKSTKNVLAYVIPGIDDKKRYAILDYSSEDVFVMFFSDGLSEVDNVTKIVLSLTDKYSPNYVSISEFAFEISTCTKIASTVSKVIGYEYDHDSLVDEIMTSSMEPAEKKQALEKSEELLKDQQMFTIMTAFLPMFVTACGITTGAPAILFSGMIAIMSSIAPMFWQYRTNEIKSGNFKINWAIDPSGYVYDIDTNERLEGITATAYWVEYDESEDFWDRKPSDDFEGTLWNAAEYSQMNPLMTDSEGCYAWDVPEGWWRVKYEGEGYRTTWSEWMTVPPVQTDVNIGMKKAGWHYDGSGWWYEEGDGSRAVEGFKNLKAGTYYIGADGYRVTGWLKLDGLEYFFREDGKMETNLRGDANGNNALDEGDILLISEYLATYDYVLGRPSKKVIIRTDNADYDGNGIINLEDLLKLGSRIATGE